MENFRLGRTLATNSQFTIFEGFSIDLEIPVILKQCPFSKAEEAEFFIRSALMKTKDKKYSQPLLYIFPDVDDFKNSSICFIWSKGKTLDPEILSDRESSFPPGNADYEYQYTETISQTFERAYSSVIQKKVILKTSTNNSILDLQGAFTEALILARCTHPNICEFLNFCLFPYSRGKYCTYIVMENFNHKLFEEMDKRRMSDKPYNEAELMNILQDMVEGMIFMKSHDISHCDINPANIVRCLSGVKLIGFENARQKVLHSRTRHVTGTVLYLSPKARKIEINQDAMDDPFESDIVSLGITMLRLMRLEIPHESFTKYSWYRKLYSCNYSSNFKGLIKLFLTSDRMPLEYLQGIMRAVARQSQLSFTREEQMFSTSAADADVDNFAVDISKSTDNKGTANTLFSLGNDLAEMGNVEEAIAKYEEADAIFSAISRDEIDSANNLYHWGIALHKIERDKEAVTKINAADAICSRFLFNQNVTADSLHMWALIQLELRTDWASAACWEPRAT